MDERGLIYQEQMTAEELAFLTAKDEKETKQFYRVMTYFMIVCFVIPFVFSWFRAVDGVPQPFSFTYYFGGVAFLLAFAGFCSYIAYMRSLNKVKKDIKENTKTVERTKIKRKQYMPHNKQCYFYLDSPNKLSIEVAESDYKVMEQGDEISIEYSTYAKFYFGYF